MVRAKILEAAGDLNEALSCLKKCLDLPGVKRKPKKQNLESDEFCLPSLHDRASIFLTLAQIYRQMNDLKSAGKVISAATKIFRGTSEEIRILIGNSELALKRGDTDAALKLLNRVEEDHPAYHKTIIFMADIYLKYKSDRQRYAQCYQQLVEANKTRASYILLGEAYMKIQQPNDAIDAYESALKMDPSDVQLTTLIGKALVGSHDYVKAIGYYESALRNRGLNLNSRHALEYDLANLYFRLEKLEQAIRVLDEAMLESGESEEVDILISNVKKLLLLAKVYGKQGTDGEQLKALEEAKVTQTKILDKLRGENPESFKREKLVCANLLEKIANYYETVLKDDNKALTYLHESLTLVDTHR